MPQSEGKEVITRLKEIVRENEEVFQVDKLNLKRIPIYEKNLWHLKKYKGKKEMKEEIEKAFGEFLEEEKDEFDKIFKSF